MSYPSGPPSGYPGPPPQQGGAVFGQPPSAPSPLSRLGNTGLLTLGVLVLSLVAYFCSYGGGYGFEILILLAGGLLAGANLLPKTPNLLLYAAILSVTGGLGFLDTAITNSRGGLPIGFILVLVFGLLQAVASVVLVLLDQGIVKMAPRPAVPHPAGPGYGGYPPQQQAGQHPQQPQQQQQQPGQHAQATQYMGQPNSPQSTQFMQHPGQISHPQTPPGGHEYE
jgi:hypothetical protein